MNKFNQFIIRKAIPLLLLAGGFLVCFIYFQFVWEEAVEPAVQEKQNLIFRRLDGVAVVAGQENLLPVAVTIENHYYARPVSGLAQAKVVYEFLTEASITRFLALYDLTENLEKIGPVRSARPYFIDITKEYGALYAHSGGSPAALDWLSTEEAITNLDEGFGYNTDYFWRDYSRESPHNLYTSTEKLSNARNDYKLENKGGFESWRFKDKDPAISEAEIQKIEIDYSASSFYQVIWQYNQAENKYERWQDNQLHLDSDGAKITADNIIIQFAQTRVIDGIGRKNIELKGRGEVVILRDGQKIEGTWFKEKGGDRTRFYDLDGNEILLNQGKIWVEVVPDDLKIKYNSP